MTLAPDCGLLAEYSWDHTVASPARIRDAALGGKDNYSAERLALSELEDAAPGFTDLLRTVRAWHVRVVRLLAARGFDQFLTTPPGCPPPGEHAPDRAAAEPRGEGRLHRHRPPRRHLRASPARRQRQHRRRARRPPGSAPAAHPRGGALGARPQPARRAADDRRRAPRAARRAPGDGAGRLPGPPPPGSALALSCWSDPGHSRRAPGPRPEVSRAPGIALPPLDPRAHRHRRPVLLHRARPARTGCGAPRRVVARRPSSASRCPRSTSPSAASVSSAGRTCGGSRRVSGRTATRRPRT